MWKRIESLRFPKQRHKEPVAIRRINLDLLFAIVLGLPAFAGQHVVVIDAGHGGGGNSGSQAARTLSASNNATSPSGLLEKDLTLQLSLEIKKQLETLAPKYSGTRIDCVMTRIDDKNPDFSKRATICSTTKIPPSAIVSIHFNASDKHNALGTLAVVHNKNINQNYQRDLALAKGLIQATHTAVADYLPASKALSPISDAHLHNGAGSNFFYQLSQHPNLKQVPKCFLEIELMDRGDVDKNLLQARNETFPAIARKIASFLYDYCATTGEKSAP